MKRYTYIIMLLTFAGMVACGPEKPEVEKKKAKLEKMRKEASQLKTEISALEKEIAKLDPDFGRNENNIVLVSADPVQKKAFQHRIEIRGSVQSRKNVMMSAERMGKIETILVSEGDDVRKGQLLMTLNADVIKNNIEEVKTSLELARIVFERQSNLWEKNIGTEIQYLEARNQVKSLERRLETLNSQLAQARITAPFSGSVDEIPVKVGEMAAVGLPLIRIVQPDDLYIDADVSEAYIGKFKAGDQVNVFFPSMNEELQSEIMAVSKVINDQNRTFTLEVKLPKLEFMAKPNQVVVLSLQDYYDEDAFVVPTKVIQSDDKGKFIYMVDTQENETIARKKHVETGLTYESMTEIIEGLSGSEQIIHNGYRELTDGMVIKLDGTQLGLN